MLPNPWLLKCKFIEEKSFFFKLNRCYSCILRVYYDDSRFAG